MFNYNLKDLDSVKIELSRLSPIMQEIENLKKLEIVLALHAVVKTKNITGISLTYIKSEYNDEGLENGAYFDYKTKLVPYCSESYLDESQAYQLKLGGEGYFYGSEDKEWKDLVPEMKKYTTTLAKLNQIATLYYWHNSTHHIIKEMEGMELRGTLEDMIKKVCGEAFLEKWKIATQREELEKTTPQGKKNSQNIKV